MTETITVLLWTSRVSTTTTIINSYVT